MSDPETVTGAPGVQSHVPGQDTHDQSAAGVAPGAGDLDAAPDPDAPAGDSLDASGDSMGDDAGAPGDDAAAGETTGSTALNEEDATDEDSGGPGDDAAAGESTTATGH